MRARAVLLLGVAGAVACSSRKAVHCAAGARHGAFTISFVQSGATAPTLLDYSCGKSSVIALGTTSAVTVLQFSNSPTFVPYASLTLVGAPLAVGAQALIASTADVPYADVAVDVPTASNAHSCLSSDLGTMSSDGTISVTAVSGSFASGSFDIPQFCQNGTPELGQVLGTFSLK